MSVPSKPASRAANESRQATFGTGERHGSITTPDGRSITVDIWVGRRTASVTLSGQLGINGCINESQLNFNRQNRNSDGDYDFRPVITDPDTIRFISRMRNHYVDDNIDVEHFRLNAQPNGRRDILTIYVCSRRAVSPLGANVEDLCRQWGHYAWTEAYQIYGQATA